METTIRLSSFLSVFAILAFWEFLSPRRSLTVSRRLRWFSNLSVTLINPVLLRLVVPILPTGMAIMAQERGWGVLNYRFGLPYWAEIVISVVALDCLIYVQHVMFHALPLLWRVHSMHHTDMDLDVTSGLRFHPIEMFLSMAIKLIAVILIGPPVLAVIIFEVVLNATSMFEHANVNIPSGLDRLVRLLIVTPDMHRVHHSVIRSENARNFGFSLSLWDRLFGTYLAQPSEGHMGMTIGLPRYQDVKNLALLRMLYHPFTRRNRTSQA
jgi:sterol desaturase/sphingolipid hydroxylase (fatty acid hydroxylase superfamily)